MYKQTTFIITAALLLTAAVASALYTINTANAQSNSTGGNKTNANASKAKVITMTNPSTGVTIGKIQKISPSGNMTNATK